MKTISLVIPFYNTSRYLLDAVKYAIDDDFISEIIINDDRSTCLLYTSPSPRD